jgi:hypothetical protein
MRSALLLPLRWLIGDTQSATLAMVHVCSWASASRVKAGHKGDVRLACHCQPRSTWRSANCSTAEVPPSNTRTSTTSKHQEYTRGIGRCSSCTRCIVRWKCNVLRYTAFTNWTACNHCTDIVENTSAASCFAGRICASQLVVSRQLSVATGQ